jgi:hypothetical protein
MNLSSFLLLAHSFCPNTKFVNHSKFPWNDYDKETYEHALSRCGEKYPNSRCVKYFEKHGKYGKDYHVICGAPKELNIDRD